MTQPIIVVKMPCQLLYIIQLRKSFTFSASKLWSLIACYNAASDWPHTFYVLVAIASQQYYI